MCITRTTVPQAHLSVNVPDGVDPDAYLRELVEVLSDAGAVVSRGHTTIPPTPEQCPKCGQDTVLPASGGGVACTNCPYWYCA